MVDDPDAVRAGLSEAGVTPEPGRGLTFRDPWGNQVQIVDYAEIQFAKTEGVRRGMGLEGLAKSDAARRELCDKGLAE